MGYHYIQITDTAYVTFTYLVMAVKYYHNQQYTVSLYYYDTLGIKRKYQCI